MKKDIIRENDIRRHADSDNTASKQVLADQDEAIRIILRKVQKKWGGGQEARREDAKDDVQETVVLSADSLNTRPASFPSKKQEDDLPETIILSPSGLRSNALSTPVRLQTEVPETLGKTVILQDSGKTGLVKKEGKKPPEHDFLTETILLKPSKKKDPDKDEK
jgi:hypothetical protein